MDMRLSIEYGQPTLKENWLYLFQKPSIVMAPQLGVGAYKPPPQTCYNVDQLYLVPILRSQSQLWIHECSGPVMSRKHCFHQVTPDICLLKSFCPLFHDVPKTLGGLVT